MHVFVSIRPHKVQEKLRRALIAAEVLVLSAEQMAANLCARSVLHPFHHQFHLSLTLFRTILEKALPWPPVHESPGVLLGRIGVPRCKCRHRSLRGRHRRSQLYLELPDVGGLLPQSPAQLLLLRGGSCLTLLLPEIALQDTLFLSCRSPACTMQ